MTCSLLSKSNIDILLSVTQEAARKPTYLVHVIHLQLILRHMNIMHKVLSDLKLAESEKSGGGG